MTMTAPQCNCGSPLGDIFPDRGCPIHGSKAIKEEMDALRDRVAALEAMLGRIKVHGASGIWSGEDCAIGAIAALEGEDAARAFMAQIDAPGDKRRGDPS
jgi:hypothetical protein